MTKRDALDFWENFLAMSCGADADTPVDNPAVAFTKGAEAGEYDDISEDEYKSLMNRVGEFSYFWKGQARPGAGEVLLRALQATDIPKPVIAEIADRLAECSARTRYGSPWLGGVLSPRILGRAGLRDYASAVPDLSDIQNFDGGLAPGSAPKSIYDGLVRDVYGQDEADKIVAERVTNNRGFNYNDVVQNQLLKILDGDVVEFGKEKDREPMTVDCSRVSVVMLGAFETLVGARAETPKPIGFGSAGTAAAKDESAPVGYDELVKAGMRRELAGRVQLIAQVHALDLAGYESILLGRVLRNPDVVGELDISASGEDVTALASASMDAKLGVRWMASQVANAAEALLFDHPEARRCVFRYPPCRLEPEPAASDGHSPAAGKAPKARGGGGRKRKKDAEEAAEAAM